MLQAQINNIRGFFSKIRFVVQGGIPYNGSLAELCGMYFKYILRKHPELVQFFPYYHLVESYRNLENRICHRTLLNIGFLPEFKN